MMNHYILDYKQSLNVFVRNASDITGLAESSVKIMLKVERNRKPNGKFDKGWRYAVRSRRSNNMVTTLESNIKETK